MSPLFRARCSFYWYRWQTVCRHMQRTQTKQMCTGNLVLLWTLIYPNEFYQMTIGWHIKWLLIVICSEAKLAGNIHTVGDCRTLKPMLLFYKAHLVVIGTEIGWTEVGNNITQAQRPGLLKLSMLKSMLVTNDFQTWHLIGWQHNRQPIGSQVRKSLLTSTEFNMDLT